MAVKQLTQLFKTDKKPHSGLYRWEWAMLIYLAATTIYILCAWKQMNSPADMLLMRARVLLVTLALWGTYRLYPAPVITLARATAQLLFLSWWYPDTYNLNNILPNLDHFFAQVEQNIFAFQPAAVFSSSINHPVFSELMYLGYAAYFPMIALTAAFAFFYRKKEFNNVVTIILTSFFIYYVIFILVPVTGPQYYYLAVGENNILNADFPNLHQYFHTHDQRMTAPGWTEGLFYQLVEAAHQTGERPTAAFPSSHVGITTILLFITLRLKSRSLFLILLPFALLMLFATVYIKAHYAIDVIAGLISATIIYICIAHTLKKYKP